MEDPESHAEPRPGRAPDDSVPDTTGLTVVSFPGDSSSWRIGTSEDVEWINRATTPGRAIDAAIPPVFPRYATIVVPDSVSEQDRADTAVVDLLQAHTPPQPWWLGYLDTGAADTVFPAAAQVIVYTGWHYVLVQAGPEQAATWRRAGDSTPWHGGLPELLFPADRSWLVSTLWDDDWRCVGGPDSLIAALLELPGLEVREVGLGADATPPGHQAI